MSEERKDQWKELYKVESVTVVWSAEHKPEDLTNPWQVKTHDGEVVGRYRDGAYAVKQARRKYKKAIRRMEKQLSIR